jgi:hypothetical protein
MKAIELLWTSDRGPQCGNRIIQISGHESCNLVSVIRHENPVNEYFVRWIFRNFAKHIGGRGSVS